LAIAIDIDKGIMGEKMYYKDKKARRETLKRKSIHDVQVLIGTKSHSRQGWLSETNFRKWENDQYCSIECFEIQLSFLVGCPTTFRLSYP